MPNTPIHVHLRSALLALVVFSEMYVTSRSFRSLMTDTSTAMREDERNLTEQCVYSHIRSGKLFNCHLEALGIQLYLSPHIGSFSTYSSLTTCFSDITNSKSTETLFSSSLPSTVCNWNPIQTKFHPGDLSPQEKLNPVFRTLF